MVFNFAKAIAQMRKQRGLTKKKLAELAGLSESFMWRIEKSQRPNPSLDSVIKIANVLEISLDELVFGTIRQQDAYEINQFLKEFQSLDSMSKKGILAQMKELNRLKK